MKAFRCLRASLMSGAAMLLAAALSLPSARAQNFDVSTPGNEYAYLINGTDNSPAITLTRGNTYTFTVNTDFDHPFALGTSVYGPAPDGVTGNDTSSGTITYIVPTNAPDCVYYCSIHGFSGAVQMVDPGPAGPPAMTIVKFTVGTNIVLTVRQATTNGFAFIPEAKTSLASTNWFALTVQSNSFANGTNQIWCGKPPGTNVFVRIRAQ